MPIILDPKILKIRHDLTKLEVPQKWCPGVISLEKYFSFFQKTHAIFARDFCTRFSHAIFEKEHAIFARETKSALKWSNLDGFSKFLNLNRSKFNCLQLYF